MPQIALLKTADEAKEAFPQAAQVLKKNTYIHAYMDGICDSVRMKKCKVKRDQSTPYWKQEVLE